MDLKDLVRKSLNFLHLDLSKNLEYDRLTKLILKKVLREESNCVDVGCHKGEILEQVLKYAPNGKHLAFEPLLDFYNYLNEKYGNRVDLYPFALSDKAGSSSFQYVKNAPAYSGFKKRSYAIDNPEIEEITVEVKTLDALVPEHLNIDLIKIDVEGGELGVLKGAERILRKNKPIVIFECGLGASEFYGTTPADVFDVLNRVDLRISTLKGYLNGAGSMNEENFVKTFERNEEYYFVAHP